jgi:hypothetical protein
MVGVVLAVLVMGACSGSDDEDGSGGAGTGTGGEGTASTASTASTADDATADGQRFPDVVDVEVERTGEGTYEFAVTISSPYDTAERYADGWRISGVDGTVYGTHELTHDHAAEQPFTRTESDVRIPDGVREVVVEGRDLVNGYGGQTATVPLPDG